MKLLKFNKGKIIPTVDPPLGWVGLWMWIGVLGLTATFWYGVWELFN